MNILILEDSKSRQKDFKRNLPCATIVETADACIKELNEATETWDWVFLDHDLGGNIFVDTYEKNTGSEVVRWICANKPKIKQLIVHSLNDEAAYGMVRDLTGAEYSAKHVPFLCLDFEICYAS